MNSEGANAELLVPSLIQGSPLFSNINVAQHSKHPFRFQLFYENRFLLKDLSPKYIAFEKSFASHQLSVNFSDWGNKYIRERGVRFNYSIPLSGKVRCGIGTRVQSTNIFNRTSVEITVLPTVGIQFKAWDKYLFHASFSIRRSPFFDYKLYVGCSHEFSPSYSWYTLFKSSPKNRAIFSGGIKHERSSGSEFYLQINSKSYPFAVAYKLRWQQFSFRFSFYYHLQLGISNHLGVTYQGLE